MKVLITGSSGFVGTNLAKYLKGHKFEVITYRRDENLFNSQFSENYLNDSNIYAIIHLAGKAHDIKNVSNSKDYYIVNTDFTKRVYDSFLKSNVKYFITLSSVKAVADKTDAPLTEDVIPAPKTHYGKSKLLAEEYILSLLPKDQYKKTYLLRPCMIHGPGNKGNLNLLYSLIVNRFPWPLGNFTNKRSFLSVENLCFIIKELLERNDIDSGIYNVSDDDSLSTNEIVELIGIATGGRVKIYNLNEYLIRKVARIGDFFNLPLNTERLEKLTENYIVDNSKIKKAIGKPLPLTCKAGILNTFKSFSKND